MSYRNNYGTYRSYQAYNASTNTDYFKKARFKKRKA